MKRYIKASFDSSMPDWLKADRKALDYLDLDQNVDLQNAIFSKTPQSKFARPIYLMNDGQSEFIYIPAPNSYGDYAYNNNHKVIDPKDGKRKAVKYLAKKTLADNPDVVDICYFTTGSKWTDEWKQRQEDIDPRYKRDRLFQGNHPKYQGQYLDDKGAWKDNSRYGYDKSGYKIPSGEKRLTDFYTSDSGESKFVARYEETGKVLKELKSIIYNLRVSQLEVPCKLDYYYEDTIDLRDEYDYISELYDKIDIDAYEWQDFDYSISEWDVEKLLTVDKRLKGLQKLLQENGYT